MTRRGLILAGLLITLAGCVRYRVSSTPPPLPPQGARVVVLPMDDLARGGQHGEAHTSFTRQLQAQLAARGVKVSTARMPADVLGKDRISSAWGVDRVSVVAAGKKLGATAVVFGVVADDELDGPTKWMGRPATAAATVQWVNVASGQIEGMAWASGNGLRESASSAEAVPVADVARKLAAALVAPRERQPSGGGNLGCVAIAPLADRTKSAGVGLLVSDLIGEGLFGTPGVGVLDRREFTDVFAAAEIPVPDWIAPDVATDLARVLNADALVHGIVDRGNDPKDHTRVRVTLYLTDAAGEVRWFRAEDVRLGRRGVLGPQLIALVERSVDTIRPLTDEGGPGQRSCFPLGLKDRIVRAAGGEPEEDLAALGNQPPDAGDPVATNLTAIQRGLRIKLQAAKAFRLPGIVFTESGELERSSHAVLDNLAAVLTTDRSLKVSLEGHVDNSGDPARDQVSALGRALRVRAYLVSKGVRDSQVTARSRGSSRPLLPNITLRGRRANRRIEVVLRR